MLMNDGAMIHKYVVWFVFLSLYALVRCVSRPLCGYFFFHHFPAPIFLCILPASISSVCEADSNHSFTFHFGSTRRCINHNIEHKKIVPSQKENATKWWWWKCWWWQWWKNNVNSCVLYISYKKRRKLLRLPCYALYPEKERCSTVCHVTMLHLMNMLHMRCLPVPCNFHFSGRWASKGHPDKNWCCKQNVHRSRPNFLYQIIMVLYSYIYRISRSKLYVEILKLFHQLFAAHTTCSQFGVTLRVKCVRWQWLTLSPDFSLSHQVNGMEWKKKQITATSTTGNLFQMHPNLLPLNNELM